MYANHCGTSGAYGAGLDCHASRFVASEITLARYGQVFPEGLQIGCCRSVCQQVVPEFEGKNILLDFRTDIKNSFHIFSKSPEV